MVGSEALGVDVILKLQRSLFSSDKQVSVLIYSKKRKILYMGPLTKEIRKFMGNEYKIFVFAHLQGTEVVIDAEAPWQDW